VFEDEVWRLDLQVPPPAPIQTRPRDTE